ncbi:GNAT family N-acetyltransferase [Streptomyces gamaensis]|uniref:GNAT family N-acetyltransferase n=1 Tax=Streptomyces gamaensis TaxID=1763542 RepID=A0ABW0YVW4_9ACTN
MPITPRVPGPPPAPAVGAGVRRGTASDLRQAVQVLAEAFADDPVARWQLPDPGRRAAVLPAFFAFFVGEALRVDGLLVAGDLAGVRLFSPPCRAPAGEAQDAPAHAARKADFERALRERTGEDAHRTLQLFRLLDARRPRHTPHYHLVFSAVRPSLRGRGIGTATLRHVLRRADRERVGVYVESSTRRSQRLVLRHGFVPLPVLSLPGGPCLHPSWRAPVT